MEISPMLMNWQNRYYEMAVLPKAIYMFNVITIKILRTFITEIEKLTLNFIWKHKRPQITKAILNKKSNAGSNIIPTSKYTSEL
jgi:hypothetical protein